MLKIIVNVHVSTILSNLYYVFVAASDYTCTVEPPLSGHSEIRTPL